MSSDGPPLLAMSSVRLATARNEASLEKGLKTKDRRQAKASTTLKSTETIGANQQLKSCHEAQGAKHMEINKVINLNAGRIVVFVVASNV